MCSGLGVERNGATMLNSQWWIGIYTKIPIVLHTFEVLGGMFRFLLLCYKSFYFLNVSGTFAFFYEWEDGFLSVVWFQLSIETFVLRLKSGEGHVGFAH
jgi:hypothetical protein